MKEEITLDKLRTLLNNIENAETTSARDICLKYMEDNDVHINKGNFYQKKDLIERDKVLAYKIFDSYRKRMRELGKRKVIFTLQDFELSLEWILEDEEKLRLEKLRCKLKPVKNLKEFDRQVELLADALCGRRHLKASVEFRRAKAFIAHWVWQVMMKLHEGHKSVLDVGNESMLVFYSPDQKTGKSTTVRWMLKEFLNSGTAWKIDFARLDDNFSLHNLSKNYVAIMDEMAHASRSDAARFKQLVTEDEISYRVMHSQKEMRRPKLACLIGTTNTTCRILFGDTSGLRRFHEIEVNSISLGGVDFDKLKKVDFKSMFVTVPLSKTESPLFRYISEEELSSYEDWMRPRHVVEQWMEESGYVTDQVTVDSEFYALKSLYDDFVQWTVDNGVRGNFVPTKRFFSIKLESMGGLRGRRRAGGEITRGFHLNRRERGVKSLSSLPI